MTRNRTLQTGDAVSMGNGGCRNGFPSDMTRMAIVEEPPEGYGEIREIVEVAVVAVMAAAKSGALGCDVDLMACGVIADAGYGT